MPKGREETHENRQDMMLWLALRIVRTARRSNSLSNIVYRSFCRVLQRTQGEDWFRPVSNEKRKQEVLLWLASEIRRLAQRD